MTDGPDPKSVAQEALDAARRLKAAKERRRGYDWHDVAQRNGYPSAGAAMRDVMDGAAADRAQAQETVEHLRAEANQQLRDVIRAAYGAIDSAELAEDPTPGTVKAAELLRRAVESLVKLNGLAAPQQVEVASTVRYELAGLPDDFSQRADPPGGGQ